MNTKKSHKESDLSRLELLSILEDGKLSRDELQASEERLRLSTELARVAVWEYDFSISSMSRSRNHDALYGLEWQHTWDLNTFNDAIHPDDRDFSNQMIQRSVSPGGPDEYSFDFRVIHPDQSLHWLSVVGQVVRRNSKREGMIVRGCLIDITDRKNAEEELSASEERFRAYINQAADALFVHDFQGRFTDVNLRACESLGYSREELLRMSVTDVEIDFDLVSAQEAWKQIEPDHPFTLLGHQRRKDGSVFPVEVQFGCFDLKGERQFMGLARDITQRREAEEALRKSEEQFRTAFEYSASGMCLTGLDGTLLSVNQTLCRMVGLPKEVLEGKPFNQITYPDDYEIGKDAVCQMVSGEVGSVSFEKRYLRKNGEPFWANVTSALLMDPSGQPHHFITQITDINDRKLAEEALKNAEEKFSKTFRLSPDIIILTSLKDGLIVDANENAFRVTGYEPNELLGKKTTELDIWADPEARDHYISTLGKEGKVNNFETGFNMRSGEIRTGLISGEIIEIGGENFILGVIRDITERKQTEVALHHAEEKFSKIFRLGPDIMTLTSIKKAVITDVNENAIAKTGYSWDELVGNATTGQKIWANPDDRNRFIKMLVETGSVFNFETMFRSKSGNEWTGVISGETIEIGEENYILSVIHDITKIKESEELLSRTMNRLIEAEEQLRREAAQQLHDQVGQNLTALTINLNFLRQRMSGLSNEDEEKRLTDSLRLLDDTIDRIRDVMTDLRPSILDDYGLYAALSWSTTKFTERTHIPVKLVGRDPTKRPPSPVEYALFRISQEALHNVLKHAHAGQVNIELTQARGMLTLSIQDDGVGFDSQKVGKGREKGFGLINIAERMKAMGGEFEVQSSPGKGTKILLRIKYNKR